MASVKNATTHIMILQSTNVALWWVGHKVLWPNSWMCQD